MSKLKVQIKSKSQISNIETFDIESFGIPLVFACLSQAGILTFEILFTRSFYGKGP
jgi:hypothetical protein